MHRRSDGGMNQGNGIQTSGVEFDLTETYTYLLLEFI